MGTRDFNGMDWYVTTLVSKVSYEGPATILLP